MIRGVETAIRSRSSTSRKMRLNASSGRSRRATSETCSCSIWPTGTASADPRRHSSRSTTCVTGRFGSLAASTASRMRTPCTRGASDYSRSSCVLAAVSPRISFLAVRRMRRYPVARSIADSTSMRLSRVCQKTGRIRIPYVTQWEYISLIPAGTSVTFRTGWGTGISPRRSSTFESRTSVARNAIARRSAHRQLHGPTVSTDPIRLTFFREFVNHSLREQRIDAHWPTGGHTTHQRARSARRSRTPQLVERSRTGGTLDAYELWRTTMLKHPSRGLPRAVSRPRTA